MININSGLKQNIFTLVKGVFKTVSLCGASNIFYMFMVE